MSEHQKTSSLPPFLQVFIVGKAIDIEENVWEFQGVFSTEEEARKACEGHSNYFFAPANLGELLPDETAREWPRATYPNPANVLAEHMAGMSSHIRLERFEPFNEIPLGRFTLAAADVLRERVKQDEKWGEQNHGPEIWLAILHEETGELAQAILHTRFGGKQSGLHRVRSECVHAAAVALSMLESLDRAKWEWPMENPMVVLHDKARLWKALSDIVGISNFQDLVTLDKLFTDRTPPHLSVVQAAVRALLASEPETHAVKRPHKSGKTGS